MRKLLTLLTASVLVLAAASCGTSGGESDAAEETTTTTEAAPEAVPVEEWADGFCSAFSTWLDEIEAASASVQEVSPDDLESAQAAVSDLFGQAAAVTEDLIAEVEGLGAPDIEDGDQLPADITEKFQGFVDAAEAAQAEVDDLELDLQTFESEFDDLITRFQDEVTAVGDSFAEIDSEYQSQELNDALSSSCTF